MSEANGARSARPADRGRVDAKRDRGRLRRQRLPWAWMASVPVSRRSLGLGGLGIRRPGEAFLRQETGKRLIPSTRGGGEKAVQYRRRRRTTGSRKVFPGRRNDT